MTGSIRELRDQIITEAIASVHKWETRPEKIRGCLQGLEICRTLDTPEDYQAALSTRYDVEDEMRSDRVPIDQYWEYRCATAQIEFVWERLRILWGLGPSMISGNAVLQLHRLIGR